MLGMREVLARFIRRRFRDWPLKPSRRVILLFVLLFTIAAIYLLYEGITSSNYLLIALVVVAYMFLLGLEARLSLRPPGPSKNSKPAKKSTRLPSAVMPDRTYLPFPISGKKTVRAR